MEKREKVVNEDQQQVIIFPHGKRNKLGYPNREKRQLEYRKHGEIESYITYDEIYELLEGDKELVQ